MANVIWRGDAPKVAQVNTWSFGGTWEVGDKVKFTIGTKVYSYSVTSTTITTFLPLLVTALNALDSTVYPELREITWSSNSTTLTGTSATAGRPFTVTISTTESNDGAADSQTIEGGTSSTGTAATVSTGPNDWSVAANWSTGAVPVNSDVVYIENSNVSILYGLAQSGVTLAGLYIPSTYTGAIGLPTVNRTNTAAPYYEYRATQLAISATTCTIGQGAGAGSGRIKINFGSAQTAVTVYNTATSLEDGIGAFLFVGTHASNALTAYGGSIGIAQLATQTAAVDVLQLNGASGTNRFATVYCGTGATIGDVTMTGGALALNGASDSLTTYGGTATLNAGAHPIVAAYGGTVIANTTGAMGATSLLVGSTGTLDFDQTTAAKDIDSAISAYKGATILNANGTASALVVTPVGCSDRELNVKSPVGKAVTYSA